MLIGAALDSIAEAGIQGFTVDAICARAKVSRGLITHHFGTMEALLVALYDHLYAGFLPPEGPDSLDDFLDHVFSPAQFNRRALNIWLTFWSEISNRPALRDAHRQHYAAYRAQVAGLLAAAPQPDILAQRLICLIDGLGLQHCIDPESLTAQAARRACLDLVQPYA